MTKDNRHNGYLTGRLLVSAPDQEHDIFKKSCILVCAHDENGAMGLILNKFENNISLSELLIQMEIPISDIKNSPRIYTGGPVSQEQGFILHDCNYKESETAHINQFFNLTTTVNILSKISQDQGPTDYKIFLGFSSWRKGQLENEILNNMWITLPATKEIVFSKYCDTMWYSSLSQNGINPQHISVHNGSA
ncbi:MAG: YqgE/AlgH family protein [Alphaproteobacteria bacterium]